MIDKRWYKRIQESISVIDGDRPEMGLNKFKRALM